ncbi:MAG: SAM-dependent chlorinase/fluorinase [Candidatus Bathyarchaeia archaeon]
MRSTIITLTTDFGLRDPYVAELKATILSISPNAHVIDISHMIEKFNIKMGAYVLACAAPYFPEGTIHVAVVDPTVGSPRRPIIIQTERSYFVGPDNGLLVLAAKKQRIMRVHEITNPKFMMPKISNTFHGRDIFAPVAAHLANGIPLGRFGPETKKFVTPQYARVVRKGSRLIGEVLHIDDFGNIITNFVEQHLTLAKSRPMFNVNIGKAKLRLRLYKAYADALPHKPFMIVGSHGFLEVSVNQGDAARNLKVNSGDKVVLSLY